MSVSRTPRRSEAASKAFEARMRVPVLVAALAAIPSVALHLLYHHGPWHTVAVASAWVIWAVFVTESAGAMALHPRPRAWAREHWWALLIIAASFPPLASGEGALLASLRITKLLKLLKLGKLLKLAKLGKLAKTVKIARKFGLSPAQMRVVWIASAAVAVLVLLSVLGVWLHHHPLSPAQPR